MTASLNAASALDLWERAQHLSAVERAVALAAACEPALPADGVAALPLGGRDARLLRLGGGPSRAALDATAVCGACGERVEFACDVEQLLAGEPDGGAPAPLSVAGHVVRWRLPDSRDVVAAARVGDVDAAREILLDRCVLHATGPGGAVAPSDLPAEVCAALDDAIAAADPLAEVLVELACPACDASFVADLDVASFVWAELDTRARLLLADVDALARAYGWTESEVLALGEHRRATYLRLARAERA